MTGFILYTVSVVLRILVKPFSWGLKSVRISIVTYKKIKQWILVFSWKKLDNKFLMKAIANDKFCNHRDAEFLNALFLTKDSKHKFGNPNETISSVLGKNYLAGTLSEQGYEICALLDELEKDHVLISIDNTI